MRSQLTPGIVAQLEQSAVIAVLVLDDERHAVPVARALLNGGITAMELTLRTPAAMACLRAIVAEVPEMMAGMGTILTAAQVKAAADAGAVFGVAPGVNPHVVTAAQDQGFPFAPGIATPSDIETAVDLGCVDLKFFPAEPLGGLKYLNSMAAPYKHLGLQFIPLGGINSDNLADYIQSPLVRAVGGSWLASSSLILKQDWQAITDRAAAAKRVVESVRKEL